MTFSRPTRRDDDAEEKLRLEGAAANYIDAD